jgi:hypothetical protein
VTGDPFTVLGLERSAGLDEVRSARRRLAFELHPDRGGDPTAMQSLNVAFEACVAHLTGRRLLPEPTESSNRSDPPGPVPHRRARREPPAVRWGRERRWVEQDMPSFTVDALPVETFEALLIAVSWIGEVIDDDPPYVLECLLRDPSPCWCRLELVPDAGGSTVSLTVSTEVGDPPVSADTVRDVWVEQLNQVGRPQL